MEASQGIHQGTPNRVALFIDVDNVYILAQNSGLPFRLSLIIDRVREHGRIMSARAYADWTDNRIEPIRGDFRDNAIELVELLTSRASKEHKNTADIQLAVDALEMVFSPVRPDVVVIVGGDRDYVPLVQKLKRYGVFVMGIGVEAGVSGVLSEACDSFVFYDDIVPPPPEEDKLVSPISSPDPVEAFALMRRAIEAINSKGRVPTGASVHEMMKLLSPAFNLERYKPTFKALAQAAQDAGYILLTELPGSDFNLATTSFNAAPDTSSNMPVRGEYDLSTREARAKSYGGILRERRIPLLPWNTRKKFVQLLWENLDKLGSYGMTFNAMRDLLVEFSQSRGFQVSHQMIQKLLYTLNFARCFSTSENAATGYIISIPGDLDVPLYTVVDVEEAMNLAHREYIKILAYRVELLDPNAVFDLLYGDKIVDEEEQLNRHLALVAVCNEIKPMNQMAQALIAANR